MEDEAKLNASYHKEILKHYQSAPKSSPTNISPSQSENCLPSVPESEPEPSTADPSQKETSPPLSPDSTQTLPRMGFIQSLKYYLIHDKTPEEAAAELRNYKPDSIPKEFKFPTTIPSSSKGGWAQGLKISTESAPYPYILAKESYPVEDESQSSDSSEVICELCEPPTKKPNVGPAPSIQLPHPTSPDLPPGSSHESEAPTPTSRKRANSTRSMPESKTSSIPENQSKSSKKLSDSPEKLPTSPDQPSASPEKLSTSPRKPSPSPEKPNWATPGPSPMNRLAFQRYARSSTFYMPPNIANKEKRDCRKRFADMIRSDPSQLVDVLKYNDICYPFLHPKHCNRHTIFYAHSVPETFCLYCRSPYYHTKTALDLGIMTISMRCQLGLHNWKPVDDHQYSLKCSNCAKTDPFVSHWGPVTDQDLLEALT